MLFDIFKTIIPCAITIGLMYAFNVGYQYVWILFLLLPVGVIPFTYVSSFLFTKESVAQTLTIFLNFLIAGIGVIVAGILRLIPSTYTAGDVLVWVFKVVPTYCLTDTIMYSSQKTTLEALRPDFNTNYFYIDNMGGDILMMCVHGVVWTVVLILIEARAFNWLEKVFNMCSGKKIPPKTDIVFDSDVIEEEERVAGMSGD